MQSLLLVAGLFALFVVADSRLRPSMEDYRTPGYYSNLEDSDLALPDDLSPLDERIEDYELAPLFSRLRRDAPKKYCGDQLVKIVKLRCALKAGRRKRSASFFSMVAKRDKGTALVKKCCVDHCSLDEIDETCS